MPYIHYYPSPLGGILLAADDLALTGLWFVDKKRFFAHTLAKAHTKKDLPVFEEAKRWLNEYFSGQAPSFMPPVYLTGTAFQQAVWKRLCEIPYGETTTYGRIAESIAKERGIRRMSSQAVGGAVGHNPISIIIPCHRVVGADGSLVGYGGGIERKMKLLEIEHVDMHRFFIPKHGQ